VRASIFFISVSFVPLIILLSLTLLLDQMATIPSFSIIQVPGTQPTIQDAINAAMNGDTILVSPGIYNENINFLGKAITVTSVSGPEVTIIDGNQLDSVVRIVFNEQRTSVLSGFTIRNGKDNNFGGGIRISSSPTISGNIIINNQAETGSGIYISQGSPLIQNNIISGNFDITFICCGGGGGIYASGSPEIIGNTIINNKSSGSGAGIKLFATGTPIISNNIIARNTASSFEGGGIALFNTSEEEIVQNLIVNNTASSGGGFIG